MLQYSQMRAKDEITGGISSWPDWKQIGTRAGITGGDNQFRQNSKGIKDPEKSLAKMNRGQRARGPTTAISL